ncbi:MAG TPA: hypothetical protein PK228_00310, partial [Saprospiraceae bacterium]|nr:hypothetical protein [Saprospiraceae bacterium]
AAEQPARKANARRHGSKPAVNGNTNQHFPMSKNMINIIICSTTIALASCTGQATSKPDSKEIIADSLSNKDFTQTDTYKVSDNDLTKIYSRAISDYITEVSKQDLMVFDTLYLGKRNNGQPDDFPNIVLPATINNIEIRLIEPEVGKKLQEEKKLSVYINLIGWVDKDKAEFIFVTFSNGFEHKFDCHIYYQYDSDRMEFDLTKSQIEIFSKK